MKPACTVCICTHNPRADYLRRTLAGLQAQTLAREQWELLLIDNASREPLAEKWDLSWHPRGRHVREEKLGLTASRIRGIRESPSDILVFVDDDNVLQADYLAVVLGLMAEHTKLGCLGAGTVRPEFEREPAPELRFYTAGLALRTVDVPHWSNSMADRMIPFGAGLAVRRPVAEGFVRAVQECAIRAQLGRKGTDLTSGEDDEFSWIACQTGWGKGVFPALQITHLIDQRRVEKNYLLALTKGQAFSQFFLNYLHNAPDLIPPPPARLTDIFSSVARAKFYEALRRGKSWLAGLRRTALVRAFDEARRAGLDEARKRVAELPAEKN